MISAFNCLQLFYWGALFVEAIFPSWSAGKLQNVPLSSHSDRSIGLNIRKISTPRPGEILTHFRQCRIALNSWVGRTFAIQILYLEWQFFSLLRKVLPKTSPICRSKVICSLKKLRSFDIDTCRFSQETF